MKSSASELGLRISIKWMPFLVVRVYGFNCKINVYLFIYAVEPISENLSISPFIQEMLISQVGVNLWCKTVGCS